MMMSNVKKNRKLPLIPGYQDTPTPRSPSLPQFIRAGSRRIACAGAAGAAGAARVQTKCKQVGQFFRFLRSSERPLRSPLQSPGSPGAHTDLGGGASPGVVPGGIDGLSKSRLWVFFPRLDPEANELGSNFSFSWSLVPVVPGDV